MLIVFLIALVVRATWVTFAHVTPISDFARYDALAWQWLSSGDFGSAQLRAYTTPGYPGLLALIYAVFGRSYTAAAYVQAIITAIGCAALVALASRFFSIRTSVLAGLLYTVSPTAVAYTPVLASENLAVPLLIITLAFAASVNFSAIGGVTSALAGVFYGLLFLTRPASIFFLPGVLLLIWGGWHRRLRHGWMLGAFVAATALTMSPWIWHKHHHGLGFSPLSTNGGINLWLGNNPRATHGGYCDDAETIEPVDERTNNARYRAKAISWIRHNPRRYAGLCCVRALRLLGTPPDHWATRHFRPSATHAAATSVLYKRSTADSIGEEAVRWARGVDEHNKLWGERTRIVLAPIAVAALLFAIFRLRDLAPLLAPHLLYLFGLSLTFVQPRFRELSDPLFCILLASLLSDLVLNTHELGKWPRRSVKAGVTILAIGASIAAHSAGVTHGLYTLQPQVELEPPPATTDLSFDSIEFHEPASAYASALWGVRTEEVVVSLRDRGLRCRITVPDQRGQYGGVMFPTASADALRFRLQIVTAPTVHAVYVDGYDVDRRRIARWERRVTAALPLTGHDLELTLRPGADTRGYRWVAPEDDGEIHEVHVFVRVKPDSIAVFELRNVEVGREVGDRPSPATELRSDDD